MAELKNKGIEVCLMSENAVIPECDGHEKHFWASIEQPEGHRSGWHVDECVYCGGRRSYDTSD